MKRKASASELLPQGKCVKVNYTPTVGGGFYMTWHNSSSLLSLSLLLSVSLPVSLFLLFFRHCQSLSDLDRLFYCLGFLQRLQFSTISVSSYDRKPVQWQLSRVFFHYAKWHLLSMGHWRSMRELWQHTVCSGVHFLSSFLHCFTVGFWNCDHYWLHVILSPLVMIQITNNNFIF